MYKILILEVSDSDCRLMSGLSHRHFCSRLSGVKIIIGDLFPTSHSRFCPCPVPTLKRERLTERICDITVMISGV